MKSSYYVATVVKAYREALDAYAADPQNFRFERRWLDEMSKASHREYTTGFYLGKPTGREQNYDTGSYIREYDFVGLITGYDAQTGIATIEQRNRFAVGEELEVVSPHGPFRLQQVKSMKNADGESIDVAPHPQMTVTMPVDMPVEPYTMLRRKG
jgi:putative protease